MIAPRGSKVFGSTRTAKWMRPIWRRPLLQHQGPLPDSQSDPRPMLDRLGEDRLRLIQVAPGIEHVVDFGPKWPHQIR